MENEKIFQEEEQKLFEIIQTIKEKMTIAQRNFDSQKNTVIGIGEGMRGAHLTRESLMSLYATEIISLRNALKNPYFGKMDFKKEGTVEQIYIGKKSILDKDNKILSYDWRSPIASMYYDYSLGEAKYQTENQIIKGEILKKRQLVIEDSKLISVDEHDTLTNDKILLKYLNESADSRLKSIVATIQQEQNKIIRNPLKTNYIVQGVAGSGKTTVALHRIAYLLYNDAKNLKESDFMILGPNKYFLNYISELLPDLDIINVSQSTFEEIAIKNIDSKVKLESQNVTLQKILSGESDAQIINFKSSIKYLKLIEDFVYNYISSNIQESIVFEDIELCNNKKIKNLVDDLKSSNKSYGEKIQNFIKILTKNIKEESSNISHEVWLKYREEFKSLEKGNPRRQEILDITNEIEKEIKLGCPSEIKRYFKFLKISNIELYKKFIESLDENKINDSSVNINLLKKSTLDKLNKKTIGNEDLAPLLYINYLFTGIKSFENFSRLVIDEGQDLSLSQYCILKILFPKSIFDIYGDLNQSIYNYQGISDWETLDKVIFGGKSQKLTLNKGYRTTQQICDSANYILEELNVNKSDNVAREGSEIKVNQVNDKELVFNILSQINDLLDKKYKTIAIICKDNIETDKIYKELDKLGLNIHKISEKDLTYHGGVCIMPSYLSKGLEFDSVILYNADEMIYNSNSKIDMKLLYVAMTRALHELHINYSSELTKPLKRLVNDKDKIKKDK